MAAPHGAPAAGAAAADDVDGVTFEYTGDGAPEACADARAHEVKRTIQVPQVVYERVAAYPLGIPAASIRNGAAINRISHDSLRNMQGPV